MKIYYDGNDDGVEETLITKVIQYPKITQRINKVGLCVFQIRDRLGALYTTWSTLDHIKIKVEDDNSNVLFRGYVTSKKFSHNVLSVTCKGIGQKLNWKAHTRNYIYAEGCVKYCPTHTVSESTTSIEYPNSDTNVNWTNCSKATHWEAVDGMDGDYIGTVNGDANAVEEYGMTANTTDVVGASISQVVVGVYGYMDAGTDNLIVSVNMGDGWEANQTSALNMSPGGWKYFTFAIDPAQEQGDVAGMAVRVTAGANVDAVHNYVIYQVKATLTYNHYDHSILDLYDLENEADYSWDNDYWINDRNVGLLISDNTNTLSSKRWQLTAVPTLTNMTCTAGTKDSADAMYNNLRITLRRDSSGCGFSCVIGNDGAGVISTDQKIAKIAIRYRIATSGAGHMLCYVKKDGTWIYRPDHTLIDVGGAVWGYNQNTIWLSAGGDTNVKKYLTTDAGNYDELQGIKWEWASGGADLSNVYIDYLVADVYYYAYEIDDIMEEITDSGATWVDCSGIDWTQSGVDEGVEGDFDDGDSFQIGENTTTILGDIFNTAGITLTLNSTLTKFIAQWYQGVFCMDILTQICNLEGLYWWEDYVNDKIVVSAEADFADSGVDLTNANYHFDWEISDDCNLISKVHVYGNAAMRIYAFDEDDDSTSEVEEMHIDNRILSNSEAKSLATSILTEKGGTKRPHIKIPLQGVNTALTIGDTVTLTMVNPTIAEAQYPITKIERERKAYSGTDDIFTTIHVGMGGTTPDEIIVDTLNNLGYLTRKLYADRLTTTAASSTAMYGSITWDDIIGADSNARTACIEDDAYGAGWNGDTTHAPTQNAVYDKISTLVEADITDFGTYIGNLVEDTTPELGGNLDCKDKTVTNIKQLAFNDGGATVDIIRDEDAMGSNDAAALATQQSIKAYVDAAVAGAGGIGFENGTYTGNGAINRSISCGTLTGQVYFIIIWKYFAADNDNAGVYLRANNDTAYCNVYEANADYWRNNRIDSLGVASFVVDDDATDQNPNSNGQVYHYVAWGVA